MATAQHVCESVSNINAGVLKNNCFPDHAKSFLRFCSSRGVLVQSKMSCIGKNCLHGRWGLRISKEIRKSLEVCFVYGVKFIRRQTQTSFVASVYKYRGPCMSLLAVCTEHPADLHWSFYVREAIVKKKRDFMKNFYIMVTKWWPPQRLAFYVISDCHDIQQNWALLLAPPQSGAHSSL